MNEPTNREIMEVLLEFKNFVVGKFGVVEGKLGEHDRKFVEIQEYAEQARELLIDFKKNVEGALEIVNGKLDGFEKFREETEESISLIKSDIVVIKSKVFAE